MLLKGKNALITGSARGIGAATAEKVRSLPLAKRIFTRCSAPWPVRDTTSPRPNTRWCTASPGLNTAAGWLTRVCGPPFQLKPPFCAPVMPSFLSSSALPVVLPPD